MAAIDEIVGEDGFSIGDVVTQEQLDKLKEFNSELSQYFTYIGANKYEFTGDPLDF
jgi:hypothetical protein